MLTETELAHLKEDYEAAEKSGFTEDQEAFFRLYETKTLSMSSKDSERLKHKLWVAIEGGISSSDFGESIECLRGAYGPNGLDEEERKFLEKLSEGYGKSARNSSLSFEEYAKDTCARSSDRRAGSIVPKIKRLLEEFGTEKDALDAVRYFYSIYSEKEDRNMITCYTQSPEMATYIELYAYRCYDVYTTLTYLSITIS